MRGQAQVSQGVLVSVKGVGRTAARRLVGQGSLRNGLRQRSLAGRVPRSVWRRLPAPEEFTVPTRGSQFRFRATRPDVGRRLYWRGLSAFEPETLSAFAELAARSRLTVDVGANAGIYTLLACASSRDGRVLSLEPVKAVHEALAANVRLNGWSERCELLLTAATSAPGEVEFIVPDSRQPSSAHLASAEYRSHAGTRTTVRGDRLDDLVTGPVDLVKIDVEGAEDQVLEGMNRILTEDRPDVIVECLPEGPFARVERVLREHGYAFFHLTDTGPVPVDAIQPDPQRRLRNFLCRPPA